jgi:hypothetical protein
MTPFRLPAGRRAAPAAQREDEAEFDTDTIAAIPSAKTAKARAAEVSYSARFWRYVRPAKLALWLPVSAYCLESSAYFAFCIGW